MSNRYARILAAGGVAVLATALGIPEALAAGTWTVQPGGGVQAQAMSGQFIFTDTRTGSTIRCTSSTADGKLRSGSGLPGSDVGSLSSVGFSLCSNPAGPRFTLQPRGLPWHVNFSSYNAAKGVVRGTVSHIRVKVSGVCNSVIDGTSATGSNGKVTFRYTDSTGQLRVLTTFGNLHFYEVQPGCLGVVNSGDPATLSAIYTVSPKQAITSP